jgi:hypothetical protein
MYVKPGALLEDPLVLYLMDYASMYLLTSPNGSITPFSTHTHTIFMYKYCSISSMNASALCPLSLAQPLSLYLPAHCFKSLCEYRYLAMLR